MQIGINTKIQKALCRAVRINEYENISKTDDDGVSLDLYNDKLKGWFTYCSPVYRFTNENIAWYYNQFDFKDKRVLTVCGSGDHVLNAILLGAREIDCFDISMFAFLYFDLKRAAIKSLNYEEFLSFFCYSHYSHKIILNLYSKVYRFLTPESKMFWDNMFLELNPCFIMESKLFDSEYISYIEMTKNNIYLINEEKYNELKNKIDGCVVNFENCNIKNLFSKCNGLYDFIGLSNIYGRSARAGKPFNKEIFALSNLLNQSGVMVVNYNYRWSNYVNIPSYLKKQLEKCNDVNPEILEEPVRKDNSIYYCRRR